MMIQIECVKCGVYFRTTGAEQLLCLLCRDTANRLPSHCIGCGRSEDELHSDKCAHISGATK